jgi:hypothetical protein
VRERERERESKNYAKLGDFRDFFQKNDASRIQHGFTIPFSKNKRQVSLVQNPVGFVPSLRETPCPSVVDIPPKVRRKIPAARPLAKYRF